MIDRLHKLFPYLLLAPAVLPLAYVSGMLYPYITPKTFLLQFFGIAAFSVFSFLALSGRSFYYGRLRAPATWIPAALLFIEYIASVRGVGFYHSFWGLFERGDGLLTYTVIAVFFYLLVLSADRLLLERLAKTVAVVAGIVALIAVLQWATTLLGEKPWFLPPVTGRVGSTFGNAAFLAGYLGMAFFMLLLVYRDARGAWRKIYLTSAMLALFGVMFAATRGTMLALAFSCVIALVAAAWKGSGTNRRMALYGLAALALAGALFFVFRGPLSNSSFEPIRRIASISLTEGTIGNRFFVWEHLLDEGMKRPLLGYGAEHIAQAFDAAYDPSAITEQWFDRAHNAFLDYFIQYGILGLGLYLALLAAFARAALALYRREGYRPLNLGLLFLLLIITYAVQNFFVFDTPQSLWLLYALFALLIVVLSDAPAEPISSRFPRAVPASVAAALLILVIPAVIMPLAADLYLTRGYTHHVTDVRKANAYFARGLSLNTYADLEYGYQAYEMYTGRQATLLSGDDRVAAYEYAVSMLTHDFNKYPYDARTATYLGHVLDTTPPEAAVDDSFDQKVLTRAISLSPLRAQAWYMLANISLRNADALPEGSREKVARYRDAIAILEAYAKLEPTLPVPRYLLATLYLRIGEMEAAKKWADEAYLLYTIPDAAAAAPAVKYYLAVEDWKRAAQFLADLADDDPSDYNTLYDLAKVSFLAGYPVAAEKIVQRIRLEKPELLETDQNFLNAITEYERTQN